MVRDGIWNIEKYDLLIMQTEKRQIMEGIKIFEVIRSGHHQIGGDERKNILKYLKRTTKQLGTKLYSRNLIKGLCPL